MKCFAYALLPHDGGFSAERVVCPAYAFNYTPIRAEGVQTPVVAVDVPNVLVESVKPGEDGGIILRLYECERGKTNCTVRLGGVYACSECNMLEETLCDLGATDVLNLTFRSFEVKTIRLVPVRA